MLHCFHKLCPIWNKNITHNRTIFQKDLKINAKERAMYKYRQPADSRQTEEIAQADNCYVHINWFFFSLFFFFFFLCLFLLYRKSSHMQIFTSVRFTSINVSNTVGLWDFGEGNNNAHNRREHRGSARGGHDELHCWWGRRQNIGLNWK